LKIKTRRIKTDLQKQEAFLDDLWSEYIRKRAMYRSNGCERCHHWKVIWKNLQAAHCFGRDSKTTRWDTRNGAGLCGACHMYIDSHEDAKFELFRELIGDSQEFELLYILAHMTTKQAPVDRKATEIALKMMIKELDSCCTTTP